MTIPPAKQEKWCGVASGSTSNSVREYLRLLKKNAGEYSAFQSDVADTGGLDAFESYLADNGFNDSQVSGFRGKIEDELGDWQSFSDAVDGADSYEALGSHFKEQTAFSGDESDAKVVIHDRPGVTARGEATEAGDVEIRCNNFRVATDSAAGETSLSADVSVVSVSTGSAQVETNTRVEFTAGLENTGEAAGEIDLSITVDGEVVDRDTVAVRAGETKDYKFGRVFRSIGNYTVGVNGVDSTSVTAIPEGPVL